MIEAKYTENPWIRIVIVTFNSGCFVQRCIEALAAQKNQEFEVVVVDNNSNDGALETIQLPDDRFTLHKLKTNIGFAEGSNLGLKGAITPYVMTLNPDTFLDPNCLNVLRAATLLHPNICMFSPLLFSSEQENILDGAGDSLSVFGLVWKNGSNKPASDYNSSFKEPFHVFSPSGAAAVYQRNAFDSVGGFDSDFFCYLEDVDLGLRLRARGAKCLLLPEAKGVHLGGHSSDKIPGFALEKSSENNIALIIKSAPILILPIMLFCHFLIHIWFQFRNKGSEEVKVRHKGFCKGIKLFPFYIVERSRRKCYPFGATLRVSKALSWSLKEVKAREVRILRR